MTSSICYSLHNKHMTALAISIIFCKSQVLVNIKHWVELSINIPDARCLLSGNVFYYYTVHVSCHPNSPLLPCHSKVHLNLVVDNLSWMVISFSCSFTQAHTKKWQCISNLQDMILLQYAVLYLHIYFRTCVQVFSPTYRPWWSKYESQM
jgi:hypothetical protein